jgi:hypothetical protein
LSDTSAATTQETGGWFDDRYINFVGLYKPILFLDPAICDLYNALIPEVPTATEASIVDRGQLCCGKTHTQIRAHSDPKLLTVAAGAGSARLHIPAA